MLLRKYEFLQPNKKKANKKWTDWPHLEDGWWWLEGPFGERLLFFSPSWDFRRPHLKPPPLPWDFSLSGDAGVWAGTDTSTMTTSDNLPWKHSIFAGSGFFLVDVKPLKLSFVVCVHDSPNTCLGCIFLAFYLYTLNTCLIKIFLKKIRIEKTDTCLLLFILLCNFYN